MIHDPIKARATLEARRAELENLREISAEARATVNLDQQSVGRLSRMDALQMQAMAEAQERQRTNELARIEAALARLDDAPDDYGYCIDCDELISEKRLEIDPAATRCVRCA
ncbi:MAG: TraR/DksA C4-type zinc finger protein [Pseudomonadota bacterium]